MSNVKTVKGLAFASVKTFNGLAIASVKTINGLDSSAGITYLLNEDFEGSGTPSGWSVGGSTDPDYTGIVLAGSQSLRYGNSASDYANYTSFPSEYAELWGKFMFRRPSSMPASFARLIEFVDISFNSLFKIILGSGGELVMDSGSIYDATTDTMSADTTYYIWWHYKKGTGSNAAAELWFDTANTRPTTGGNKYAGGTAGNRTANAWGFGLANDGSSGWMIVDNFQLAETEFT